MQVLILEQEAEPGQPRPRAGRGSQCAVTLPRLVVLVALLVPTAVPTALGALEGPGWRVSQSSFGSESRALIVTFADEMETFWSAESCAFLAARSLQDDGGGTDLLLVLATAAHRPWMFRTGGATRSPVPTRLRAYRRRGEDLVLDCELRLDDSRTVLFELIPSPLRNGDGAPGLLRLYRTYDVPAGVTLEADVSMTPLPSRKEISSDTELEIAAHKLLRRAQIFGRSTDESALLRLRSNGTTRLEAFFTGSVPLPATDGTTAADRTVSPQPAPRAVDRSPAPIGAIIAPLSAVETLPPERLPSAAGPLTAPAVRAGLLLETFAVDQPLSGPGRLEPGQRPNTISRIGNVALSSPEHFGGLRERFCSRVTGRLRVAEAGDYELRLTADDGAALWIDGRPILEHDGRYTEHRLTGPVELSEGEHDLRIEHFQNFGAATLELEWRRVGEPRFRPVAAGLLSSIDPGLRLTAPGFKTLAADGAANRQLPPTTPRLAPSLHPALEKTRVELGPTTPRFSAVAITDGNRLSAIGDDHSLWAIDNALGPALSPRLQKLMEGFRQPLALVAVGGQAFVLQPSEILQLVDVDGDRNPDEVWSFADGWQPPPSPSPTAAALEYRNSTFFARLDSDRALEVSHDAEWTEAAPSGISSTDLRSALDQVQPHDKDPAAGAPRLSDASPLTAQGGAFEGQSFVSLSGGGLGRWVPRGTADLVQGAPGQGAPVQGALLPFAGQDTIEAWTAGTVAPDGTILLLHSAPPALTRLRWREETAFEIRAVYAKANGFSIELTEPLGGDFGWRSQDYELTEHDVGTGGGDSESSASGESRIDVLSASVSPDRRTLFVETPDLHDDTLVHLALTGPFLSESGSRLWNHEAWVSIARVPDEVGEPHLGPTLNTPRSLSEDERRRGWRLLFDGRSLSGWRGFASAVTPSSWRAQDGMLALGGDGKRGHLMTRRRYRDFELVAEWAVAPGADSGILYRVLETRDTPHGTGPEYQIVGDAIGAETSAESTAAAHGIYPPLFSASRESLRFNTTRIVVEGGRVEHWLNGYLAVGYELSSADWDRRVEESGLEVSTGYGRATSGHIVLEDNGGEIWFRSLKIRDL